MRVHAKNLTASIDIATGVRWIRLVYKDKPWTGAISSGWHWACLRTANHILGGLTADAVLAFVLKSLVKLKEQNTAVNYLSLKVKQ